MHEEGHVGMALLLYAPVAFVGTYLGFVEIVALSTIAVVVICPLPDLDLRIPIIKHRGITHTYLAAVVTGLVVGAIGVGLAGVGVGDENLSLVPFSLRPPTVARVATALFGVFVGAFGVLAHLAGDVVTPMGITPKYPFDDTRYTLDLFNASNRLANVAFLVGGALLWVGAVAGGTALRTAVPVPLV